MIEEKRFLTVMAFIWGWVIVLCAALAISCSSPSAPTPIPIPVPSSMPTPVPIVCHSVPKALGDCHQTNEDVYLSSFTFAQDSADSAGLLFEGEIRNGRTYLDFLIANLKNQGLCAAIYENEEIAIWNKADQSFSENWDAIREPGDGRILPRTGPGAHSWSCWPPTTEAGS